MPKIIIIAAVADNRVIGNNNQLIWHIPEDMAHFKALTQGHTVIMGRKTWESLPERFRPLPNRKNIVITRQVNYLAPGSEQANSLEDSMALLAPDESAFVIGGGEIYAQALNYATHLELTEVHIQPEGDTLFPTFSPNDWHRGEKKDIVSTTGINLSFSSYTRS